MTRLRYIWHIYSNSIHVDLTMIPMVTQNLSAYKQYVDVVSFKLSENICGEKVNQSREESAAQLNQSIELSHLLIQKC